MLVCARGVGVGEDYSSNFASHLKLSVYQLHAHLVYDIYLCCFSPPIYPTFIHMCGQAIWGRKESSNEDIEDIHSLSEL